MVYSETKVILTTLNALYRKIPLLIQVGGTNSGKTYGIVAALVLYMAKQEEEKLITVVAVNFPYIRRDTLRIFIEIVNELEIPMFHQSLSTSTFGIGMCKIEFIGMENPGKATHGKRDILYINEASLISYMVYKNLDIRADTTIMDYNPHEDFWLQEKVLPNARAGSYRFVRTTYRDNPAVPQEIVQKIEALRYENANLYRVLGLGLTGSLEGLVFPSIRQVDSFPRESKRIGYGMDFGYSCFEGSTRIYTDKGDVEIKDIKVGDMVLTRSGYKRVLNKFNNGLKKVIDKNIDFDFGLINISCTFNHNFNVNGLWKKYGLLEKEDKMCILQSSMVKYTKDTQMGNNQITSFGSKNLEESFMAKDYIEISMNFIKAIFQKAWIFIMSISILLITTPIIWLLLVGSIMYEYTMQYLNTIKQINIKSVSRRFHIQKKIGNKGGRRLSQILNRKFANARAVKQNINQQIHIKNSVVKNVTTNGNILTRALRSKWYAILVLKNLWETNTLNQKHVVQSVRTSYKKVMHVKTLSENRIVEVYDIEVEDANEYFANGILVHNCDPTTIVKMGLFQGEVYVEEFCYKTGMLLDDIVNKLYDSQITERDVIVADSADPRMIEELKKKGFNIWPAIKGPNSVNFGIALLNEYKINVVKSSINMIKEQKNYRYKIDRNGTKINEPMDSFNHCFIAGTMVQTPDGQKPIEKINIGDFIVTSTGNRLVIDWFNQGIIKVRNYKIITKYGIVNISCSIDHKIKTSQGWIEIQKLKEGDMIYLHKSLMEKYITNMQEKSILAGEQNTSIELFGNIIKVLSLKNIISITKMAILKTIQLLTLSYFMGLIIYQSHLKTKHQNKGKNKKSILIRLGHLLKHGMGHQLALNGTGNMQLKMDLDQSYMLKENAIRAKLNIGPKIQQVNFAQINASQHTEGFQESITMKENAIHAIINSSLIDIQNQKNAYPVIINHITNKYIGHMETFDISVYDEHEFFANGLLVSNCWDAVRYIGNSILTPTKKQFSRKSKIIGSKQ